MGGRSFRYSETGGELRLAVFYNDFEACEVRAGRLVARFATAKRQGHHGWLCFTVIFGVAGRRLAQAL
jgi:hypothetical protein